MAAPSRIDLHAHTTASDGQLAPSELVQLALASGLIALGLTDHDSTEGVAEAVAAAAATGLAIVPGVELSTDVPDGEIHVLGYFVDPADPALQARLEGLREGRLRRGEQIVERLNAAGVPIDLRRVLEIASGGAVGRPHVARVLVEAGHALSIDDAFNRYLVRGRPGYVERRRFTPGESVRTVLAAGGVPVLAHPLHGITASESSREAAPHLAVDRVAVEHRVEELVAAGLRGIEVYYPGYDGSAILYLAGLAERHTLICTGGSDFHGPGRAPLGSSSMPREVQETLVGDLRAAAGSARG